MTEAFVFDALRTPRGKGKKDGSLHEVKPINLLAGLLTELQQRHQLDTSRVDDVVMGIVSPEKYRVMRSITSRSSMAASRSSSRDRNMIEISDLGLPHHS